MSSTMQVDTLAEKIKIPTKATFLTSVFKNGLKKIEAPVIKSY